MNKEQLAWFKEACFWAFCDDVQRVPYNMMNLSEVPRLWDEEGKDRDHIRVQFCLEKAGLA